METSIDKKAAVAILSTADFLGGIWTNKQHLATGLARDREVLYIESLGLRRPTLSAADALRIYRRLRTSPRHNPRAARTERNNEKVQLLSPRVAPLHSSRVFRALNQRILDASVAPSLHEAGVDTLWSFSPLTYGLEEHTKHFVYHSVDFLHEQPGLPTRLLLDAEKRAVLRADAVIASSARIAEHLAMLGRTDVRLWENVADTDLFSSHRDLQRNGRAIFAGNLTPQKVDFDLLFQVANAGVSLALAGPVGIDGTSDRSVQALLAHPNVTYLGSLSLDTLAEEVARSRVGLIPYRLSGLTAGIFPMKTYEYLAGGLEVVSTPIASLSGSNINGVHIIEAADFAFAVRDRVNGFEENAAERRSELAQSHSWHSRVDQARHLLAWPNFKQTGDDMAPRRTT